MSIGIAYGAYSKSKMSTIRVIAAVLFRLLSQKIIIIIVSIGYNYFVALELVPLRGENEFESCPQTITCTCMMLVRSFLS